MKEAIENFNRQFEYKPAIENIGNFKPLKKFIVAGMGGSHLAADLLKSLKPELDLIIHKDYGLPAISEAGLAARLFIASSYSGNTEEIIDGLNHALAKGMPVLIITIGGKLLEVAQKQSLPYIQMPDTGIHPRNALGFSFQALLKAIGDEETLAATAKLASSLKPKDFEKRGQELAKIFREFVPVIYSSSQNWAIAYNWKIKFNETGKIPAFYNTFPELNHNETAGFDVQDQTPSFSKKFRFIFLEDQADHPKIQKRMAILKKLYTNRGLQVESVPLKGEDALIKAFSSVVLADWAAYHTALNYGLDPDKVPIIEEFKKLIA